jgi:hypothetical protein
MQLRVARLCLDCEELHADRRCPRCASASYAFLTNWLPCDERRVGRDRRAAAHAASQVNAVFQSIVRWFRSDVDRPVLATRRSDLIQPVLKHDERGEHAGVPLAAKPQAAEPLQSSAATERKEIVDASRAS